METKVFSDNHTIPKANCSCVLGPHIVLEIHMSDKRKFSTNAVHAGTKHIEGAVNTPIFQSSTYQLTDERYAGWAAGAQHTLLYARLSSVNSGRSYANFGTKILVFRAN